MKKFLAMMLALAMVLSLAACGSKTDASTDTAADAAATKDSAAEPPMPLTPPTKLNVGVVGEPNTLDCEQGGENGMGSLRPCSAVIPRAMSSTSWPPAMSGLTTLLWSSMSARASPSTTATPLMLPTCSSL